MNLKYSAEIMKRKYVVYSIFEGFKELIEIMPSTSATDYTVLYSFALPHFLNYIFKSLG